MAWFSVGIHITVCAFLDFKKELLELWSVWVIEIHAGRYFLHSKYYLCPLYIFFSVVMFVVNNWEMFTNISDTYSITTRNSSNLYLPSANLSIYQKGTQYIGIKIFNNLPINIKQLYGNINLFKKTLLQFLYLHSFYSIDEFLKYKVTYLHIESID
jgi:hypothetical protein